MTTRHYSANAQPTTLSADITNSATSISVGATTGFPAVDFVLALDYGTSDQELVLVTGVSGTTLTVTRGLDSTTAVAHTAGAAIRHVHSSSDFTLSRSHEDASTGVHGVTGSVVGTSDTQALTNKDLSSGNTFPTTHVTTTGSQTLTNKTVALGSNTVSGTLAQFNTAVTDADLASLAGAETLTNKTIDLADNTVTGTLAEFNTAVSDADLASLAGIETLTNKTLNLSDNTLVATTAQINTALSDNDIATLAGTETLSNKTLAAPVATGSLTSFGGAWTAFTPVRHDGTGGTALGIGNGTISGGYTQIGKTVHFYIHMLLGSTTPLGSTFWTFELPVAPANAAHIVGAGGIYDSSAPLFIPVNYLGVSGSEVFVAQYDGTLVRSTGPISWASSDQVRLSGTYEVS